MSVTIGRTTFHTVFRDGIITIMLTQEIDSKITKGEKTNKLRGGENYPSHTESNKQSV